MKEYTPEEIRKYYERKHRREEFAEWFWNPILSVVWIIIAIPIWIIDGCPKRNPWSFK